MPRRRQPPRLYLRRRPGRPAVWTIKDGGAEVSTGFGEGERGEAEEALARHILRRHGAGRRPLTCGEALALYLEDRVQQVIDPERLLHAGAALAEHWDDLPVSAVTTDECARYGRRRGVAPGTLRRELGALQAALNHARRLGLLAEAPAVTLPARPPSAGMAYDRGQAARLLRACRSPERRHLARFVRLGLWTGTRKAALLRLRWTAHAEDGWIDVERGVLHRAGTGRAATSKRQPPARLGPKAIAACLRWRRDGADFVIHRRGAPVAGVKRAWASATAAAGVPGTPHWLRHTAISWAVEGGAERADLVSYFGVSWETLERTYWHLSPHAHGSVLNAMRRRR